jgi:tetratricopeptide (TPR) repeat protein
MEALEDARKLLARLNPEDSTDTETLGLLQAVHKRMWNLAKNRADLDKAIWSSEKGFYLKNDYYNGINLAYLYNARATISETADAIADFVLAQRTRRRVVTICQTLLDQAGPGTSRDSRYWTLATLAEAWTGLGEEAKAQESLDKALALDPPPPQWMIDSTQQQLANLRQLLADSPLKKLD